MKITHGIPESAPAFDPDRSDYPLGGVKTGPIWRTTWALLRDSESHSLPAIIAHVHETQPDAHVDTIRNILFRAVRAGILIQTTAPVEGLTRPRLHFRVKVK